MRGKYGLKMGYAFLMGLSIGVGVAILFAPNSGEETRANVLGAVQDGVTDILSQGEKIIHTTQRAVERGKQQVKDVADAGATAYREAKQASS